MSISSCLQIFFVHSFITANSLRPNRFRRIFTARLISFTNQTSNHFTYQCIPSGWNVVIFPLIRPGFFIEFSAFYRYSNMSGRPLLITLPNNLETHLDLLLRPFCASFNIVCFFRVRKVFKCRFRLVLPFILLPFLSQSSSQAGDWLWDVVISCSPV